MKKTKQILALLILLLVATIRVQAQKITYNFGNDSDVSDSLKYVVDWYKMRVGETEIRKLNLYVIVENCNGYLDIYISQFATGDRNLEKLVKNTNRHIPLSKKLALPVLFATDILNINDRAYINQNGYYIKAEKNEMSNWKVKRMNPTF
ncbi:hypothetical protein [Pseudoflavitalea rhizosphaerae]|uniref:hypothetical protein n=1 Tax=Pseudoflavitalea rhizosphaerae TaxID=1884793 RepID=UPI000F8F4FE4|nr:hypothetical protein [Pseudoflavitalea rhizosphaerae]